MHLTAHLEINEGVFACTHTVFVQLCLYIRACTLQSWRSQQAVQPMPGPAGRVCVHAEQQLASASTALPAKAETSGQYSGL